MKKVTRSISHRLPAIRDIVQENENLKTDKGVLQLEKGNLEADAREWQSIADSPRDFLARHYIHGKGIEIGAAHYPIKMPPGASVKYVDVFTDDELRKIFPQEYATAPIVHVDVVDDGEKLAKFKDNSLDFIIANHFIEHCLDPIGTIINMYKKLRKKGVIYMAVPDKRHTFDKQRPLTTYEHLLAEHKDGTKQSFRKEHTIEAVRLTEKSLRTEAKINQRVQELLDSDFRIHYHVWTQREMTEMFVRLAADFKLDLEIKAILTNRHEVIYILEKA